MKKNLKKTCQNVNFELIWCAFKKKKGKTNMKKSLLLAAMVCALTACQTPREEPVVCPSCNPPARHFEIVTECSDYKEKDLGNGAYSQCRFCSSRIYSDGIDVTDQFRAPANASKVTIRQRRKATPCDKD